MLATHGLELVSGWYSGRLARRSVAEEIAAVAPHLKLLADNGATVMVYGEVADSIQGAPQPLYKRPRFVGDVAWREYADRVNAFARHTLAHGVRLAYHHHMGAYVQSPSDVDRLMALTGDEVGLLFDSGHMTFAGGDAVAMLARHVRRVCHVHCKDVRPQVLAMAWNRNWSFLEAVINGAFTVPGDGAVDFASLLDLLHEQRLSGLAGRRSRAGSERRAQLSLRRARLPPFARPSRAARAQLGQDLRRAHSSGAREAHQQAAIVNRADVVLDAAGQQPDLRDQAGQDAHQAEGELALGFHLQLADDHGRSLVQPGQQFVGAAPTAVGMLGAERGHALGAEAAGRFRRGVTLDEGQAR